MPITLSPAPLVSLIAGILILIVPRLLNYIVGIYLIIGPSGTFRCQQFAPAMKRVLGLFAHALCRVLSHRAVLGI